MDANFAGQCENVKNFSKDRIFASDKYLLGTQTQNSAKITKKSGKENSLIR